MKKFAKLTQEQMVALTMKLTTNRDIVQDALNKGVTLINLAKQYETNAATMSRILTAMNFANVGRDKAPANNSGKLFNDLVVVVARLAQQLDVNYDEIKPYVQ